AVRRPEAVLVNGYVFLRADLDALLAQRAVSVRAEADHRELDLGPATPSGEVVSAGLLAESVAGARAGEIRYRHTRTASGAWLIEEARSGGADSLGSWGGISSSRLELSPTLE